MDLIHWLFYSSSRIEGYGIKGVEVGIVILASCEYNFIRVHENLAQHPNNNISFDSSTHKQMYIIYPLFSTIKCISNDILHSSNQGGRGHWTINYTSTQRLITTLFYLLGKKIIICIFWFVDSKLLGSKNFIH